jgi:DNA ligase-1
MDSLPFLELARTSERMAATRSRLEKTRELVALLARVDPREIAAAVGWLVQEPTSGPLGVGPAHLWRLSRDQAPETPTLTLADVEAALHQAASAPRGAALAQVAAVFEKLTDSERAFFVGSLTGSLRQGSVGGIMQLAIAELAGLPEASVRRAVMVRGGVALAARALLGPDRDASPPSTLALFTPIAPMLASQADSVEDAVARVSDGQAAIEWKVDGVRAQVHKGPGRVAIFSRQGNDITHGCQALIPLLEGLGATTAVLDGEVVLEDEAGRARAFQDSFSAVSSGQIARPGDRLRVFLFDALHRDGVDLIDAPLSERLEALHAMAPDVTRMPRLQSADPIAARAFYDHALTAGHEGVMVKDLASPYQLGARGRSWQKVKQHATVDLVVLAVEWGSGRRKGKLSNLHLGARRFDGTFCMVGKTFKGLTDALLDWQTTRLLELETERRDHVVFVRPELVVEIRFNDVQRSPRYPGGVALRFARVVRYREDKRPADADTLESLVARLPESAAPAPPQRKQLSLFDA